MTGPAADLALAVSGLLGAVAQIAVGAVVLGAVLILAYGVIREALR